MSYHAYSPDQSSSARLCSVCGLDERHVIHHGDGVAPADREMLLEMRRGLLTMVKALERRLNLTPDRK